MVNGLNLGNLNAPRPAAAAVDKATADLEAAVRQNPTAENYFVLGEAWRKNGRKDKAAAAYQKAIELRPGYADAIKALAGLKE
jgi:cytochrome c-type biogenesis protein CcmH/NrfG